MPNQIDISSELSSVIGYVNYHYYSCPLTQFNIGKIVIPFIPSLESVKSSSGREFKIRISHGLLHAISAMEAIDDIINAYEKYVENWDEHIEELTKKLDVDKSNLIGLIKIAVLFHDSARKGDGQDLWDIESGDACYHYLREKLGLTDLIANRVADAIRYKDDRALYIQRNGAEFDLLRELVNMADNLEVIRCRDKFEPKYLEIYKRLQHRNDHVSLIDELVVPHRKRIFNEGRLHRKGRIISPGFDDTREGVGQAGYDKQRIADTFEAACTKYPDIALLSVSSKAEKEELVQRALRGVETFIEQHHPNSNGFPHLRLFANSQFSPFNHTAKDYYRAKGIKFYLENKDTALDHKVDLILMLAERSKRKYYPSNANLIPLNLEVQRSIGHYSDLDIAKDELSKSDSSSCEIHALLNADSSFLLASRFNSKLTGNNDPRSQSFNTPHACLITYFKNNHAFLDLFDNLNTSGDAKTYHKYMMGQGDAINQLAQKESNAMRCVGLTIALGAALIGAVGVLFINPLFASLFLVSVATMIIAQTMAVRHETKVSSLLAKINRSELPNLTSQNDGSDPFESSVDTADEQRPTADSPSMVP